MAAEVTIVGTRSPCVELPWREERRVHYDDHVQRLIDRGHVEVLEWHEEDGLTAGKSGERTTEQGMPPPSSPEVSGGADSPDPGVDDPVGVAAEGQAEDRAVDAPDEGDAAPRVHRRSRKAADPS